MAGTTVLAVALRRALERLVRRLSLAQSPFLVGNIAYTDCCKAMKDSMSVDLALALRVARTYEILDKIRSVAAEAIDETSKANEKVKPETAALLGSHYDHLVAVAGDLLTPSYLGRHIGWAQQGDMTDIVNADLPTVSEGMKKKVEALAAGKETAAFGFEDLLESKIAAACLKLYDGGHYKAAVLAGCDVLVDELRTRTKLTLDGVDLVNQAFSLKNPLLTWAEGTDKTSQSVRNGYTDLARGAMAAIRNVYSHGGKISFSAKQAARHLVLLSTLVYRLEKCKKIT